MREGEEWFEFLQKGWAIVGGIRENRIEFFHASALHAKYLRRFRNGIVARRQRLSNSPGDAHKTLKLVGEVLMGVDEHRDGRHHGLGLALPREHHEGLGPARVLPGSLGWLRTWGRRRTCGGRGRGSVLCGGIVAGA